MAPLRLEKKLIDQGYRFVVGIDEVGRGPLAGPVVACAAAVKDMQQLAAFPEKLALIRDSKLLSEKQRERLMDFIREHFHFGIGECDHRTIDRINILNATLLAMRRALRQLERKMKVPRGKKVIVLIDGQHTIPAITHAQRAIVKGDRKVKSIAAASIVAKVTRDRFMRTMHDRYPGYGFDRHKGYGTRLHRTQLESIGASPIHRKSFLEGLSLAKK